VCLCVYVFRPADSSVCLLVSLSLLVIIDLRTLLFFLLFFIPHFFMKLPLVMVDDERELVHNSVVFRSFPLREASSVAA
jgi:hypothetical protein